MAADDHRKVLDFMKQCFDDVDQVLADANASIPLDYLGTRLEEHFQNINAIAIAIQDNASGELKQNN